MSESRSWPSAPLIRSLPFLSKSLLLRKCHWAASSKLVMLGSVKVEGSAQPQLAVAVAAVEAEVKQVFSGYTDFSTIDGVRLALKNGWLLIRASGTEPLIRLTVEGESQAVAKELMRKATALISKHVEGDLK